MIQTLIKRKVWLCIFCLSLLTVSYTGSNANTIKSNQDSQTNVAREIVTSNTGNENELRSRIEQIAQTAQGRVGATATVLETGQSVSLNEKQRFPMQSFYKFPIAMAVLDQVDQGKLKLDQKVRIEESDANPDSTVLEQNSQGKEYSLTELLKYAVSESDNTSSDALLRLIGGGKIVTQYLQSLGVNEMVVANPEKEIQQDKTLQLQYRNYATPDAVIVLLRSLHEGQRLSKSSQALLLQLMTETSTGPKRIKGLLPEGTVVAHKTGTSSTVNGVTAATNDAGLVTLPNGHHLEIAVFVSDAKADEATREAVIAKVSKVAWDELNK
jgi:beta-lactamase class A